MKIEQAIVIHGLGGYYNDDLDAIRAGAVRDGFQYIGKPVANGFESIRQPNDAACFVLLLDTGQSVFGDATSVCYAAAGGREGRFSFPDQQPFLSALCDELRGRPIDDFYRMSDELEARQFDEKFHRAAAMYGISQALVQAAAFLERTTPAEVLAAGLGAEAANAPIPIYIQSDDRRTAVDKAVLKRADVLPHGVINDIDTAFGRRGELLQEYLAWTVERIERFGPENYKPEIHLDVYGLIGTIFEHDIDRMVEYLAGLKAIVGERYLCIETPVLMRTRQSQMDTMGKLRDAIRRAGIAVNLIVDEWANDLEDIRAFIKAGVTDMINVKSPDLGSIANSARAISECWAGGVRPILGGSCAETDQSARIVAHIALAASPAWVMARPGLAVDEGMQIVHNEMARTIAVIQAR
jgi:methylaspartate ammonia-lyase